MHLRERDVKGRKNVCVCMCSQFLVKRKRGREREEEAMNEKNPIGGKSKSEER